MAQSIVAGHSRTGRDAETSRKLRRRVAGLQVIADHRDKQADGSCSAKGDCQRECLMVASPAWARTRSPPLADNVAG